MILGAPSTRILEENCQLSKLLAISARYVNKIFQATARLNYTYVSYLLKSSRLSEH